MIYAASLVIRERAGGRAMGPADTRLALDREGEHEHGRDSPEPSEAQPARYARGAFSAAPASGLEEVLLEPGGAAGAAAGGGMTWCLGLLVV